jgi:hypothetical protein
MDKTHPRMPETASCLAVLALGVALAGSGAGCRLQMCNDQIDASARYRVTVVDVYDSQSKFVDPSPIDPAATCGGSDGLAVGTELEVQTHGTASGMGCMVALADVVGSVGAVSILGPPETMAGTNGLKNDGNFMNAGGHVTLSVGDGDLVLGFRTGGGLGGIYATPVPGQLPPVVLDANFYPDPNLNQKCLDEFVVQLAKE